MTGRDVVARVRRVAGARWRLVGWFVVGGGVLAVLVVLRPPAISSSLCMSGARLDQAGSSMQSWPPQQAAPAPPFAPRLDLSHVMAATTGLPYAGAIAEEVGQHVPPGGGPVWQSTIVYAYGPKAIPANLCGGGDLARHFAPDVLVISTARTTEGRPPPAAAWSVQVVGGPDLGALQAALQRGAGAAR